MLELAGPRAGWVQKEKALRKLHRLSGWQELGKAIPILGKGYTRGKQSEEGGRGVGGYTRGKQSER